ncbi:hypothetical protein BX600DRAFT_154496 [Xylariales sp. PMI_506]|nr:hypothetical protein BX600DRAFT_154496 [Xylariales sp. PMI_506]
MQGLVWLVGSHTTTVIAPITIRLQSISPVIQRERQTGADAFLSFPLASDRGGGTSCWKTLRPSCHCRSPTGQGERGQMEHLLDDSLARARKKISLLFFFFRLGRLILHRADDRVNQGVFICHRQRLIPDLGWAHKTHTHTQKHAQIHSSPCSSLASHGVKLVMTLSQATMFHEPMRVPWEEELYMIPYFYSRFNLSIMFIILQSCCSPDIIYPVPPSPFLLC